MTTDLTNIQGTEAPKAWVWWRRSEGCVAMWRGEGDRWQGCKDGRVRLCSVWAQRQGFWVIFSWQGEALMLFHQEQRGQISSWPAQRISCAGKVLSGNSIQEVITVIQMKKLFSFHIIWNKHGRCTFCALYNFISSIHQLKTEADKVKWLLGQGAEAWPCPCDPGPTVLTRVPSWGKTNGALA